MNNDLISREALKENEPHYDEEGYRIFYESEIDNAPTVAERPQGEWNEIQAGMFACPFCGARPHKDFKNFCAKCGADMQKGGNE